MTNIPNHLLTIAEVAAAFGGFAGIMSVFRRSHLNSKIRLWRVQSMIVTSLLAIFAALLPFALASLGFSDLLLWKIGAAFLFLFLLGQVLFVHVSTPPEHAIGAFRLLRLPMGIVLMLCTTSIQVLLLIGVFGKLSQWLEGLYTVGVVYLLFSATYHFLVLVKALQPGIDD